ncbi:hypothetical protein B0T22DRAFT_441914 [Podospora appendiculata]|uniref:Uncharacterized protein n=1 Tax=Podospora appendiculata TaxID=314037 RepID=A0AAE0XD49_9PEZI|nr:hypothetical protein B0T22DRAFT_441914 [Podospora appendiculata]
MFFSNSIVIVVAAMAGLAFAAQADYTPLTASNQSNMSITDVQYALKDLVDPADVVHFGHDGVLRVFNADTLAVQHAVPLTPAQVVEYLATVQQNDPASFDGVNGYNVPESALLKPADDLVAQVRLALKNTDAAMFEAASQEAQDSAGLGKRPTLPCSSYLFQVWANAQ